MVFVESFNIISPLGNSGSENFLQLYNDYSGVCHQNRSDIDPDSFWASIISEEQLEFLFSKINAIENYTRFEKLLIASVNDSLKESSIDTTSPKTIFIFSTTKGNISLLGQQPELPSIREKLNLYYSGKVVSSYFKNPNKPVVISNACISGIVAILYAKRLLESGEYENAVVTGADLISKFIFSGFKSFQALSPNKCTPFSLKRDGINLGEAGATIILTTQKVKNPNKTKIQISGGSVCNDSNHISGPSRTGKELSTAIDNALQESKISYLDIDFISAHGTATIFNDEMEAKAFNLSRLQDVPVNSLKGYFGHTLGAAGLVESIISIQSLKEGVILPTSGFSELGVYPTINICSQKIYKIMKHCLKTASGFGGCNAAIVYSKS